MKMRSIPNLPCRRSGRTLLGRVGVLPLLAAAWLASLTAWTTDFEAVKDFGSNPGKLLMYKYVPNDSQETRPMVVVLHGCVQDHLYARDAGWDKLADKYNFILLVPEQQQANNPLRAFTWFEFEGGGWFSQVRTKNEVKSIKQMMDKMKADYKIDPAKVYITGLSAGGAMTAIMMACHPDSFAGAGICSGLPHRAASKSYEAWPAMLMGTDASPQEWGKRVRKDTSYTGPFPKVSIWHGQADPTVKPMNGRELMEQWTDIHGIDQVSDAHDDIPCGANTASRDVYTDAQGKTLVETYFISGMGHATAIDPGSQEKQGGVPSQYVQDMDIFSSYYMARFWGLIPPPPPPVPVAEKVKAVMRLIKGDAVASVANEFTTTPAVTSDMVEGWKKAFIDAGTGALDR